MGANLEEKARQHPGAEEGKDSERPFDHRHFVFILHFVQSLPVKWCSGAGSDASAASSASSESQSAISGGACVCVCGGKNLLVLFFGSNGE
jgi:hypothetical protein